ncbi:MAG: PilZ domain-containing protein [Bosea sp. (in: a-proteobacteria)]
MAKTKIIETNDLSGIELGPNHLDGLATASTKALRRLDKDGRAGDVMRTANARAIRAALDQQQRIYEQSRPRLSHHGVFMALPRAAMDRINIAMRSHGEGNRRRVARFPLSIPCRLMTSTGVLEGHTLDLSAHGCRMGTPHGHALAIGQECQVEIEGIGHVSCNIRQHGRHGINIAFATPLHGGQRSALAGLLLRIAGEQEHMNARARELSLMVTDALEQYLEDGKLTAKELFVIHEPTNHLGELPDHVGKTVSAHPLTATLETAAGPAFEKLMWRYDDIQYLALTDRNGNNVLLHVRAGKAVPDCLTALEPDAMTLRISRFNTQATIQFRPPSAGTRDGLGLLEMSAPITLMGRRWGCARILMPTPRG